MTLTSVTSTGERVLFSSRRVHWSRTTLSGKTQVASAQSITVKQRTNFRFSEASLAATFGRAVICNATGISKAAVSVCLGIMNIRLPE